MNTFDFEVTIQGKGGHGSRPDLSINPIDCFASVHTAMNQLCPVGTQIVINRIDGGSSSNIIPDRLTFSGTFHYADPAQELSFRADLDRVCTTICHNFHCSVL